MARIALESLQKTLILGRWLAKYMVETQVSGLFLQGPLGSGKTTLARAIVENLPGADKSEINSPSFTIYNCYPTKPAVIHCDLYRIQNNIPEEIFEFMELPGTLFLVEWAEFFPRQDRPEQYLDIYFDVACNGRFLEMVGHGENAIELNRRFEECFDGSQNASPHINKI